MLSFKPIYEGSGPKSEMQFQFDTHSVPEDAEMPQMHMLIHITKLYILFRLYSQGKSVCYCRKRAETIRTERFYS